MMCTPLPVTASRRPSGVSGSRIRFLRALMPRGSIQTKGTKSEKARRDYLLSFDLFNCVSFNCSHLSFAFPLSSLGSVSTDISNSPQNARHRTKRASNCPVSPEISFGADGCPSGFSSATLTLPSLFLVDSRTAARRGHSLAVLQGES